jgi:hypothetical protein
MNTANSQPAPSYTAYVPAYQQSLKTARIQRDTFRQLEK